MEIITLGEKTSMADLLVTSNELLISMNKRIQISKAILGKE